MKKKEILIIGNINTIFTYEYILEILNDNCKYNVTIATFVDSYAEIKPERKEYCDKHNIRIIKLGKFISKRDIAKAIPKLIKRFWSMRICRNYDVVQFLFVNSFESLASVFWIRHTTRFITSFYGSDLLRAKKIELFILKYTLRRADCITLGSSNMIEAFNKIYGNTFSSKCIKADLGSKNAEILVSTIDSLDRGKCKKAFGIPENKISVFCGYNGRREHRHLEIMKLLSNLDTTIKNSICLVFHCGYELSDEYAELIESTAKTVGIEYRIIREFLVGEKLAMIRKSADVMMNLQITDALSNSMMENIYAGAIVIKGDWLKYPDLDDNGVFLVSLHQMEELPVTLTDIVLNQRKYLELSQNNCQVSKLMMWSTYKDRWIRAVDGELTEEDYLYGHKK